MRIGFGSDASGRAWAFGASCLAALAFAPAHAADDGAAPLWVGVGSIFGLSQDKDQDPIDYRERGRIVLPPKMNLPPPSAAAAQPGGAWPLDSDVQRRRAEKARAAKVPRIDGATQVKLNKPQFPEGEPATMRATAGYGAGVACPNGQCASSPMQSFNPLGWVGMGKDAKLGPEPDREWLTDPPKGYRSPAQSNPQAKN